MIICNLTTMSKNEQDIQRRKVARVVKEWIESLP
jgi:hypothetical protein